MPRHPIFRPMSDNPSSVERLLADLKRRKVFRVMAVYGATAFVVLQVADLLAEGMGLSDQLLSVTTYLVLIGFPIAVVLAWAFESTPDGMKRTADAAPEEISAILAQPASKRIPAGLMALAGIVLLFGAWWMGRQGSPGADLNLAPSAAHAADFRRIAVLPFQDLGGNEENDPFLAGLHEDIRGKLATLADLRVTSLGSVREYGDLDGDAQQVASELGNVDYLLRGSVRRSGDVARVNVWLIDAATSEDIWFEQWDQRVTVENLFAIQSQIARQVADQLEASLSPAEIEQLEAGLSTNDPAALNAYYRVRSAWRDVSWNNVEDVLSQAERVVELEPEFVEAWSLLAEMLSAFSRFGGEYPRQALEAVERTETLAPLSLEAIKARAWYAFRVDEDLSLALELFRTAEAQAPSDADVLTAIASLQARLGDSLEGARTMRRAVFLDPQNAETHASLATMLQNRSMWKAADAVVERALAIDPGYERAQRSKLWLIVQGDRDPGRALGLMAEFGLEPEFGQAWAATLDRDFDAAARMFAGWAPPADEDGAIVATLDLVRLLWLEWVEQARGADAGLVRDSLEALLARNSASLENSDFNWAVGEALVLTGREDAGWRLIEEELERARLSEDQAGRVSTLWAIARSYARFGRREEALGLLEEAVGKPAATVWSMADLELESMFDSIRDDPRFDELLTRQQAYEDEQAQIAEAEGPWLP